MKCSVLVEIDINSVDRSICSSNCQYKRGLACKLAGMYTTLQEAGDLHLRSDFCLQSEAKTS